MPEHVGSELELSRWGAQLVASNRSTAASLSTRSTPCLGERNRGRILAIRARNSAGNHHRRRGRYRARFGGLSVEETAAVMDVSERTVKREWQKARAFLFDALQRERLR